MKTSIGNAGLAGVKASFGGKNSASVGPHAQKFMNSATKTTCPFSAHGGGKAAQSGLAQSSNGLYNLKLAVGRHESMINSAQNHQSSGSCCSKTGAGNNATTLEQDILSSLKNLMAMVSSSAVGDATCSAGGKMDQLMVQLDTSGTKPKTPQHFDQTAKEVLTEIAGLLKQLSASIHARPQAKL